MDLNQATICYSRLIFASIAKLRLLQLSAVENPAGYLFLENILNPYLLFRSDKEQ